METYVIRVWLPDRPGALGAVASRIGAVRGDVVGIEILETGGGQAVDELVVRLPQAQLVELLVVEVEQVDGARVEEVRPVPGGEHDPGLAALELAARLVDSTAHEAVEDLARHVVASLGADWVAALGPEAGDDALVVAIGPVPTARWLAAYVEGQRASVEGHRAAVDHDVTSVYLPSSGLALVLGREGRPFRSRERRQVMALARIADTRSQHTVG
jgi:hypothetical protein